MLRDNLRLLIIGYSDADADLICSELADINSEFSFECIRDVSNIRSVLYGLDPDAIISNHDLPTFHYKNALDLLKVSGRDIPFIVYSCIPDEKEALSAIHYGAHDYVHKDNAIRLALVIERELRNVATRRAKLQAESQIYRLAYYDELTGLPKRNLFCEKVTAMLSKQNNADYIAAIYFITFERLPYINGTYGFSIGDILIQQLSYRLSVYSERNCLLTRIEGSKFAYFNGDVANSEEIQNFADRIMRLASTPFMINNLEFYVTLRIGICIYPTDGDKISCLLANAENTLSDSHDLWRNNCKYFIKEIGEASSKRLKLESSFRKAIGNNELVLHFQPIVDLQTGGIVGAEALVRWNHPDYGLLLPDKFLPLAQETGFIIDICKWVLKHACINAKMWHDAGYDSLSISVNISAIELDQSQLVNHVSDVLAETGLHSDLFVLEITESVLMQDAVPIIGTLQELKEMGVKLVVDNFGVGYSSLGNLRRLPLDALKIERSIIRNITKDSDSDAVITAIIALAKSLGLSVMAVGVETKDQFDFLYATQCCSAQGYLFSKPVNAENLFQLLEQRKTGTLS
ncbi:MAG: EAL domain-containing protein [Betaproteobacteria bacterium]|nr:EAL domain-containing protein [Betaproteobacteria bacterium]